VLNYVTTIDGSGQTGPAGDQNPHRRGAELDALAAEIQAIADAIGQQIIATEGNVFGVADVFLNGNRSGCACRKPTLAT
jgi:hypothetical protein